MDILCSGSFDLPYRVKFYSFVFIHKIFIRVVCVIGEHPPGGVLDISLGGEVRRGPSYPDPV